MKRELYNRWLAELRDPNNKQAHGHLKDPDGSRCCLGVLADLCEVKHFIDDSLKWAVDAYSYDFGIVGAEPRRGIPPAEWMENIIGLRNDLGDRLAEFNDNGRTFPEIANEIELEVQKGNLTLED